MSNNRYLEFDSTYRNRNQWPLASDFEIPISQSGRKGQEDALDPVCLSNPLFSWTSNSFTQGTPNTDNITGLFADPATFSISYTSDPNIIILAGSFFQQLKNYYNNCIIEFQNPPATSTIKRRILEYTYLGTDAVGPAVELVQVTLSSSLPDNFLLPGTTTFTIYDPTDIMDTNNAYFFIPAGRIQKNAYNGYILYNETQKEYRKITGYNFDTHLISLDTTGLSTVFSGPIIGWGIGDNYSIRKEAPLYPPLNGVYPTIQTGSTPYSIIINNTNPTQNNFYKNCAIRILPTLYSYNLSSPYGESRIISSSVYDSGTNLLTLSLSSPFTSIPADGTEVEILKFSYDNFNPFTYTGSLVSQQQMVCYEVELLNVILPNETLAVGEGGRIAFYPYVYVELSNVSAAEARLKNIIYSNNPNAFSVTFRVPIDDVINPIISNYVRVDGDGMVQTIKFKPNDNLYFRVTLANGEPYETILPEYYSPSPPNPSSQISACFSIRRL
jgi:hypothetical protein